MIKLACRVLDIYDDSELTVASKLASKLGDVKVAERDAIEKLEDHQFGLVLKTAGGVLRRRFPLADADSTKLSRAYFDHVAADLPAEIATLVSEKIASAERIWCGVDTATERDHTVYALVSYVDSEKLAAPRQKVAHATQFWGLAIDGKNYFPLHDASLLKTAVARFVDTASNLQAEERFVYARNIAKRASALNVEVPADSMVNLYTGSELNMRALQDAIDDRRRIIKAAGGNIEILNQLEEAAGLGFSNFDTEEMKSIAFRAKKASRRGKIEVEKIISTLQTIDKLAGFSNHEYMRGLLDPFAACFKQNTIDKHAALIVDGVNLGNAQLSELNQKFSPEFVQEFTSNPVMVYQSLPDPVKAAIRQLCQTKGTQEQEPTGDPQARLSPAYANG
jgi:hypothetical protein